VLGVFSRDHEYLRVTRIAKLTLSNSLGFGTAGGSHDRESEAKEDDNESREYPHD